MAEETALVCVTGQKSCQRLIHLGAQIASEHGLPLLVLSVSGSGANLLEDPKVSEALNDLYALSGEVGAEMTMLHSGDAARAICDFAHERHVTHLILGASRPGSGSFIAHLNEDLPGVALHIAPCE